jgi:competence protein ComEC
MRMPRRTPDRRAKSALPQLALAAVAACGVVCTRPELAHAQGEQLLRVTFVDVGQGDAIWIQGPDGPQGPSNVVIDGGPDVGKGNRLIQYLKTSRYGLQAGATIDCAFATHPHDDHFPGLTDLLREYAVQTVVDAGFPKDGKKHRDFVAAAGSRLHALRTDPVPTIACGDLTLDVLHADSASFSRLGSDSAQENNASTVLKLTFGGVSFLFMGDAEGKERNGSAEEPKFVEEKLLAEARGKLAATVLKVAHHGSETSSTLPFLRAVAPKVVVIMSGRRQFTGSFLPKKSVLDRYRRLEPRPLILRTDERDEAEGRTTANDQDGDDVYMYTDGESLHVFRAVGSSTRRRWQPVGVVRTSGGPEE